MEVGATYSFGFNITVMKMIGLYPSDNYKKLHRVYSYILYILALIPPPMFGLLRYVLEDIADLQYDDFVAIGMSSYFVKFLPFITNGEKIKRCIHYFDHLHHAVVISKHKNIIFENADTCRKISQTFLFVFLVATLTFFGQLIGQNFQQMPINVWLPKYVKDTRSCYLAFWTLFAWGIIYAGFACAATDLLVGLLLHYATAQIRVLQDSLEHLDSYADKQLELMTNHDLAIRQKTIINKINRCLDHYQCILDFVDLYQDCFSQVVFAQFTSSGLVIGLLCFIISKVQTIDTTSMIMIFYLPLLFFQIFFYCYFGTMLIEESKTLSTAVYMSRWYEYDAQSRKRIIILMERAKRTMIVRAGKLFDLSLDTFMMIIKRAYSLLALLRNY